MDSTGGLWESAYQSVSGSVSICQVYSSGAPAAAEAPSQQPDERQPGAATGSRPVCLQTKTLSLDLLSASITFFFVKPSTNL